MLDNVFTLLLEPLGTTGALLGILGVLAIPPALTVCPAKRLSLLLGR